MDRDEHTDEHTDDETELLWDALPTAPIRAWWIDAATVPVPVVRVPPYVRRRGRDSTRWR